MLQTTDYANTHQKETKSRVHDTNTIQGGTQGRKH